MLEKFEVLTKERYQLINITSQIEGILMASKVKDGLVVIFVPHSTAGVILTENETGLKKDWLIVLKKLVSGFDFLHNQIDNNADSHILSGLIGQGKTLLIKDGRLIRGTWQQIFLLELDGPRTRKIFIKILSYD